MRIRHAASVVFMVASMSIFGQEELLPNLTPGVAPIEPFVDLAVEPAAPVVPELTLADAVRSNDFGTFDALFRGAPAEAYRPLHELWTYSVTDPLGAFYGAEKYESFARAYPQFAEYIARYRIVDSRGNVFYPSSETREFLLARAEGGVLAEGAPAPVEPRTTVAPRTARLVAAPAGRRARRQEGGTPTPAAPVIPPKPAIVATAPIVIRPEPEAAVTAQQPAVSTSDNHGSARGLLLVIIGLLGIGVLALIVRAPRVMPSVTPRRDP